MRRALLILAAVVLLIVVGAWALFNQERAELALAATSGARPTMVEPDANFIVPTIKVAKAVGWKAGETPSVPDGMRIQAFATGLDHPRWMHLLPNGDVLVAESNGPANKKGGFSITGWVQEMLMKRAGARVPSADRITLLRDADGDGVAEARSILLTGLKSPFGMQLIGDRLYVANTDGVVRYPFTVGQTKIDAAAEKVTDLPAAGNHWTKNILVSPDGAKLYMTVGSDSNVGDKGRAAEEGRAAIWELDLASGDKRIYAYGLRNPNGLAIEPNTKALFTTVNERDMIGSDLVPDYLTGVEPGAFYGWPDFYWGGYPDKRVKDIRMTQQQYVKRPDYALGAHTASLGLAFADQVRLGDRFASGAFIGQHGSWNRKPMSGYKVVFVPFVNGRPTGKPVDVVTGFLDASEQARGRPVGVIGDRAGALLVADDVGNAIWRVSPAAAVTQVAGR